MEGNERGECYRGDVEKLEQWADGRRIDGKGFQLGEFMQIYKITLGQRPVWGMFNIFLVINT